MTDPKSKWARGLYVIVDLGVLAERGVEPLRYAQAVIDGGTRVLQLRAKGVADEPVLELLEQLGPMCRRAGVLLFANDRPDLAMLSGCDGVHVGQDDLSVSEVRRVCPSLKVGISTHSLEQLRAALTWRPDYAALGPVFSTQSKSDAEPAVGVEMLKHAFTLCSKAGIPLVAIGGLNLKRCAQLAAFYDAACVIGAALAGGPGAEQVRSQVSELTRVTNG